jgi:hypothetical protein
MLPGFGRWQPRRLVAKALISCRDTVLDTYTTTSGRRHRLGGLIREYRYVA